MSVSETTANNTVMTGLVDGDTTPATIGQLSLHTCSETLAKSVNCGIASNPRAINLIHPRRFLTTTYTTTRAEH